MGRWNRGWEVIQRKFNWNIMGKERIMRALQSLLWLPNSKLAELSNWKNYTKCGGPLRPLRRKIFEEKPHILGPLR